MNFRKLVALIGATIIAVVVVIIGIAATVITQTDAGRDQLRTVIITRVAASVKGSMYLGKMSGGLFTGVTIDSLEIRDPDDSLFVATGPINVRYNPRDLVDGRLIFSIVTIDRPVIVMRQHADGEWNFRKIFPKKKSLTPRNTGPRLGDWFVIDSAVVRDAALRVTMPWEPDDSLKGHRRDSAIAVNLARTDREVRRVKGGLARSWHWNHAFLHTSHIRLAHPDTIGRAFDIARLDVQESDPPLRFRNLEGAVRWAGDTIWLRAPHFDLPASTGRASGRVVWGSDLPVRYDIAVRGDSVSLSDLAWVYPTLPTDGGGSMFLRIRNDSTNLKIINYAISSMDVRTQESRLRGAMTFGVGGPVLIVKDVNLEASPVDMRLIRTFNGKPFPYDWQGTLSGVVRARGGPVNRFVVDDARMVFRDANVPGAVSRFSGRGGLDILFPAFTVFRGFDIDVAQLDLRTLQFVNPNFPRVNGYVSGTATLDSLWLDVRFRNAALEHRDGSAPLTRVAGNGRVTLEDEFIRYDLDMIARPISLTSLSQSYPLLPLRGEYSGPLTVKGTLDDLDVRATLAGAAGEVTVAGRFDLYPARYAMNATIAAKRLDLRTLFGRDDVPATSLTGRMVADMSGDSLANLAGMLGVTLDTSGFDRLLVGESRARMFFGNGRMRLDTLSLVTSAASLNASGALGLASGVSDSVRYVVHMDSLGGLRGYLRQRRRPDPGGALPAATVAERDPVRDSLAGAARVSGWLVGGVDRLDARGDLDGRALHVAGDRVESARGSFAMRDVLEHPTGRLHVQLDQLIIAGIRLDSIRGDANMTTPSDVRVAINAASANGPTMAAGALIRLLGDTTAVTLDQLTLNVGRGRWALASAAGIRVLPDGLLMEPLRLVDSRGGWLQVSGTVPTAHEISLSIRADSLSLADIGTLAQLESPLGGRLALDWSIAGRRESPTMRATATLSELRYGGAEIERLRLGASYANRRLTDTLTLYRRGAPVLTALTSLPIDLALMPVEQRLLQDSIAGWIRTDSVELGVLETFTPLLRNATGVFVTDVRLGGTFRAPRATGRVSIVNGSATVPGAGLRLQRINAQLALIGEAVRLERLVVQSGIERGDTATLAGFVSFADWENPTFAMNFTARRFLAMNRRSLAELEISTAPGGALTLDGSWNRARLRGSLFVDRGTVYIPEVFTKNITDLSDPELASMVDTSGLATRVLLPDAPSDLVKNLELAGVDVVIGDDMWIRSPEANIKLSGTVDVTRTSDPRDTTRSRLALTGALAAERGTYTLDLGPVQRTFQVETGAIRFFGDAELNPTLDIAAVHTVRQSARQDIRIRVNLGGTLKSPTVTLSSADGYRIDQPQLLSYLVTGAPTFESGGGSEESATDKAISVALRSAGGLLSSKLSGVLGLDVVQVQTAGSSSLLGGNRIRGVDYLRNTRIDLGWQLTDRVFLSANTGACKLFDKAETREYLESVGLKVDYRLPREMVLSAGTEPGAVALICDQKDLRGFVQTPRQFGFDLSKTWRF